METSPAVEVAVRTWASRLESSCHGIERCAVVIEQPHRHQTQGKTFRVHVFVTVRKRTIAITRDPGLDHTHENLYIALSDAFRAARRSLQEHERMRRGEVRLHA